ncbi:hypothetical protein JXM67_12730 [candidate division WOR-3 bacterium]|nr:hypothetical protein [candidate division WOR-3 bacterium]
MAKINKHFTDWLSNLGSRLFRFLSRCEDRGVIPKASRWLKLSLLGITVVIISACAKKEPAVTSCYAVECVPDITISDIEVKPNPTRGAEYVTITAHAKVNNTEIEGSIISRVTLRSIKDAAEILMEPLDGEFDDTLEIVKGKISVAGEEPGTTNVLIRAGTPQGGFGQEAPMLIVTKKKED